MKSFEDALAFVKQWDGAFDGRDIKRFSLFLPLDRLAEAGLEAEEGVTAEEWGEPRPWTEEEVVKQLLEDAEFGLQKAIGERGLSSNCMFHVVNMWCHLLENGLEDEEERYGYGLGYGRSLFEKVLKHYEQSREAKDSRLAHP